MLQPRAGYQNLKDSYLFFGISRKIEAYLNEHPGAHLYRMGIGDVSLPLCDAVIRALHQAVDDQASRDRFHGYMPECGAPFLREAVARFYQLQDSFGRLEYEIGTYFDQRMCFSSLKRLIDSPKTFYEAD